MQLLGNAGGALLAASGARCGGKCFAAPGKASAHVKWFCAFNVAGQPRGLENVLCPDFEVLMLTAFTCCSSAISSNGAPLAPRSLAALNRVTRGLRDETDVLIRASCGFFLVAAGRMAGSF